jgi:hypothetical protein
VIVRGQPWNNIAQLFTAEESVTKRKPNGPGRWAAFQFGRSHRAQWKSAMSGRPDHGPITPK